MCVTYMNIYFARFYFHPRSKTFFTIREKKSSIIHCRWLLFFGIISFYLFDLFFVVVVVFLQTGVRTLNHGTGLSSTLIIQNQFDLYKQIITFNISNVRFLGYFLFCQAIFYNFQGSPFLNGRLKVIALYVFFKMRKKCSFTWINGHQTRLVCLNWYRFFSIIARFT